MPGAASGVPIEYAVLDPLATLADIERVIARAIEDRVSAVCVTPVYVAAVARGLRAAGIATCALIGYPNGTHKPILKAIEATSSVKDGADEIEVVPFQPFVVAADGVAIRAELIEIAKAARAVRSDVVIQVRLPLGTPSSAIATACQAIRESGGDVVVVDGRRDLEPVVRLTAPHADGLRIKLLCDRAPTRDLADKVARVQLQGR